MSWNQKEKEILYTTMLGKYTLPVEIEILNREDSNEKINLSSIGFFFYTELLVDYFPLDIIPFAATGGDSCFFAFLTDYQLYDSIYDCPIVFISPCAENRNNLFAKNFYDFLRITSTICNAEMISDQDPKTFDFDQRIKEYYKDFEEFGEDYFNSRLKTIEFISNLIGKEPLKIESLNTYFTDLYDCRNGENFIITKDSFNLNLGNNLKIELKKWLEYPVSEDELKENLSNASEMELKVFFRNMPFIYEYFDDDYHNLRYMVYQYLPESFIIEKAIIEEQLKGIIMLRK